MPRTDFIGHCHYCERPVYGYEGPAYGVMGWEAQRSQGGANQILMRQRVPERCAHIACVRLMVDRAKRGIAAEQGALDFG